MNFYQIYKMAIKSILSNKGRSFLTMLGVIIGVASVISAVAYAQGSTKKVALIGTYVANELFAGTNPLNKTIKINGAQFKVVGILAERSSSEQGTDDDQIIIPVTVAQRLTRSGKIRSFMVQVSQTDQIDSVINLLDAFLLKIYGSTNSFSVFNQAQMLDTLNSVTSSMMLILGGIAAISLIVGGIGIMNIMLVSVTERTREIGIRKAIGAKKKNILVQFLIESLMITGIGGIIGLLLGVIIIKFIVAGLSGLPAVYSMPWMTISFGISLVVGVIFGMFPAYKAANLNPIEALRYE